MRCNEVIACVWAVQICFFVCPHMFICAQCKKDFKASKDCLVSSFDCGETDCKYQLCEQCFESGHKVVLLFAFSSFA